MNFLRFTLHSCRDVFSHLLLLTLISGSICLSSCEDDMDRLSSSSPVVSFTSEIGSSRTPSTRSTTDTDTPQDTVTSLQGGSTPLYLHTLYTDSIALPPSDSRPDRGVLTRATPIKDANMYESFGVSAYSYTGSWSEYKTPNYFYNATASKSDGGYTLSSTYYWPGSSYKMKFFAYAPTANAQYVLSDRTQAGSPTISVTIPSNVNDQKDLLVAKTDELPGNTNTAVALSFNHALTAIRFVCGNDMRGGTVKSVSLKNVYSKGTYNMGTRTWSDLDTPATFSQTLDKVTTGIADEELTSEAQTFMMLPQRLPEGAQIEVLFTDDTHTEHTLTADIKESEWPMGKTVTYKISSSSINWSYMLTVLGPADFTYEGGTHQYSVTSYKHNSRGDRQPVQWKAEFSENGGVSWTDIQPTWLTAFTVSGGGETSAQSYDATVSEQISTDHTTALKNAIAKGTVDTPYNLSNQTDGGPTDENTANCYVVSAPGYYSFPLVYGNAIKDGKTNTSAYISTVPSGPNILSPFINHAGKAITDPYICNNTNCTPVKAELVWQDAPNLVTDIKYNNTGNGNISFKVDKNTIRQGNAVIAIKDADDNVLWSWHIWVTDEDISQTIEITNHQSQKYRLMSVNLGWCDNGMIYAERSCKVKITAGDKSKEITIRQASNSITTGGGNHPYYQWGRKDPFLPSNGLSDTNKTWYDKGGKAYTANPLREDFSTGAICIKNYILKPNVMHSDSYGDVAYANLWSANNHYTANDENVIKTIYDPSPVGFKLPPGNVFTGFTTTGTSASTFSEINGTWDDSSKGWNFYTDSSKSKTIFFPASGYRSYSNGGANAVGGYGCCWSAVPYDYITGRYLKLYFFSVLPSEKFARAYGCGVRSIKE